MIGLVKSKNTNTIMTEKRGPLTPKEQEVVKAFEEASPGTGKYAEQIIRSSDGELCVYIAEMPEEEIVVKEGFRRR
jgi:myo-inositol-1-phosphate synthase